MSREAKFLSKIFKSLSSALPTSIKPIDDQQFQASISGAGVILKQNVSGWNSFLLDYSANAGTHNIVVECNGTGLDNDQWYPISGYPIDVANTGAVATRQLVGGSYYSYVFPKRHTWVRVRCSLYGGNGTITALLTLTNAKVWNGPYQLTLASNVNNNNASQPSPFGVLGAYITRTKNKIDDTGSSISVIPSCSQGGQVVTQPYSVTSATWNYVPPAGGINNSNVAVVAKPADTGGLKHHITQLILTTETLGGATDFVILDGSTVLERIRLTATPLQPQVINYPIPLVGSANTAINIQTVTGVTGGVYASLRGYLSV